MRVYHGSKSLFQIFDYDKIGAHGTSEGKGFYFTDNKEIASSYAQDGYLYTVELNYKKSLGVNDKKIKKPELKMYLEVLNKKTDYLSNWGDLEFEDYEKILNKAVEFEYDSCADDVDLIAGICNACGNNEVCLKTLYDVLGYDSIVMKSEWGKQRLFVAVVRDIIRIVDIQCLKERS